MIHRIAAALALGLSASTLVVTACGSSASSEDDDKSGADGGPGSGANGSGGNDGTDGATSTGGGDGSTTAATTGCAAYPKAGFCDDFESETTATLSTNWPESTPGSEFLPASVVTSPTAVSGTHVLHTDAPFVRGDDSGSGGAGQRFSIVSRGLPTVLQTQSIHVGFSFRIVSFVDQPESGVTGPSADVQVDFSPTSSTSRSGFALNLLAQDATHLNVFVGGGSNLAPSVDGIFAFVVGQWQRMDVTATFATGADAGQGAGTVDVSVDGAQVATLPFSDPAGIPYSGTFAGYLSLGSFGMSETPDTVVEFDDVIIEQD